MNPRLFNDAVSNGAIFGQLDRLDHMVVAYFKALSRHSLGGTEEKHREKSVIVVGTRLKFKMVTSRIKGKLVTD
jgi:hypothetical protein